jgi:hypothetical protein
MTNKTRDGIKLLNILKAVREIEELVVRTGSNHPYILNYDGMRPCPVAPSTDARRMLVPWLREITHRDGREIYDALKGGSWKYG